MIPDPVPSTGGASAAASSAASPNSTRADFDQRLANDLSAAALASPEVLAELSYTEEEIEEGKALHTAAQNAFNIRQQAVSTASAAIATRDATLALVRDDFTAYRATV